jgi:hypothetical protein
MIFPLKNGERMEHSKFNFFKIIERFKHIQTQHYFQNLLAYETKNIFRKKISRYFSVFLAAPLWSLYRR